jgi:hypothetical protein
MKQNSKHWLQWQGTKDTSNNRVVYPRAWSAAINSTAPNYLRERFKEIREDIAWATAMERQANYEVMREEWCAWEPSPALIEAVEQIEFKWDEDYVFKTNP